MPDSLGMFHSLVVFMSATACTFAVLTRYTYLGLFTMVYLAQH